MKIRKQAILLSVCALTLASCSDDNPWGLHDGEGAIRLSLATDGEVKDAVPLLRSQGSAPDVPETSEFAIRLTKTSTLEVSEFASLEEFNAKESFASGAYTVAAYYGSPEEEGFSNPYYYGEANVTVLDGRESEVSVTARLGNAMVSIDYTDAFKRYFRDYGASVHSEGHSYVEFAADETRPAYIAPGEVALTVHVTNPQGKKADLQPASFPAEAAHHYHITLDVNNGNVGQAQLVITFDDTLDKEDVTIDLTDELFTSAGPKVTPVGFADGALFETVAGASIPDNIAFNLSAPAGYKSAILTVSGEGEKLPFGDEIDLCAATPEQQALLAQSGIEVHGLWGKTDKYAVVNLTALPAHLPEGTYTVTLVAHDKFMRVSEPVSVNFSSNKVVFEVTDGTALINSNRAALTVSYNGVNAEKDITFKALDRHGVYKDCNVIAVKRNKRTRAIEAKTYNIEITVPDTDRPEVPVKAYLCGEEKQEYNVKVVAPEYSVRADAFSRFAALKIDAVEPSQLQLITSTVKVFVDGQAVDESRLNRNSESGVITVKGLEPSTRYSFQTSLYANGTEGAKEAVVTTENASDIQNGDFSKVSETINRQKIEVGGKYSYSVGYQATANIVRSEADGWASINAKTCWFDAPGAKNTWFQVPSTYAENGKCVLRNVAYDHNGTKPAGMPTGFGKTHWYNTNVPTFTTSAAGELFLGTYSFDGSEHRVNGVEFDCRPTSVSFEYTYSPISGDKGRAYVAALDASGNTIASGTLDLDESSSSKTATVRLEGYSFGVKASKLYIRFMSSGGSAPYHIPQGSELSEGFNAGNFGNKNLGDNNYHAVATGSVLTIDNVKLNY